MASSGVIWDTSQLDMGMKMMPVQMARGVAVIAERIASESQDFARVNAPWNDQTSNARNGLFAKAFHDPTKTSVVVYHTMPYGVWLELRWSGKLGIIPQTIQHNGLRMMQYLDNFFSRLADVG